MTTKKQIRIVVINPETKTIEEQFIDSKNTLESYYRIIGNGCELVTSSLSYDSEDGINNAMLCDDEILLRTYDIQAGFRVDNRATFINTAIWVGCDENGETCSTDITIEELESLITWVGKEKALEYAEIVLGQSPMIISFN